MKIKILHLYYDIMNLYGEYANTIILKKHLEDLNCEVEIFKASFNDKVTLNDYDFIYMGSGNESAQKLVLNDIIKYKDEIKHYIDNGNIMLFTGNSFEILGKNISDKHNPSSIHNGLSIFDFYTVENYTKRQTSDIICKCHFLDKPLVGFINKCSDIYDIKDSLFDITLGSLSDKADGIHFKNFFGTHLIGPIMVKNPHFLEFIIKKLFEIKGETYTAPEIDYIHETNSYNITISELQKNADK